MPEYLHIQLQSINGLLADIPGVLVGWSWL